MSTISAEEVSARLDALPLSTPTLDLLVLFGSTVKGRRRARSDLDIAVRCNKLWDLRPWPHNLSSCGHFF